MILKDTLSEHFVLLSNSGDPVKLLSNVTEISFQIRHTFEIEFQVEKCIFDIALENT